MEFWQQQSFFSYRSLWGGAIWGRGVRRGKIKKMEIGLCAVLITFTVCVTAIIILAIYMDYRGTNSENERINKLEKEVEELRKTK